MRVARLFGFLWPKQSFSACPVDDAKPCFDLILHKERRTWNTRCHQRTGSCGSVHTCEQDIRVLLSVSFSIGGFYPVKILKNQVFFGQIHSGREGVELLR
ncbi:unnamed protein product [Ectocarpus fasciculatus]